MGTVVKLVLLALVVAAVAHEVPELFEFYGGQVPGEERPAAAEEPAPFSDADVPEPAPPEAPAPPPAPERSYYRYLDAGGSLHFVDSLEQVPEAFRASARRVSMGSGKPGAAPPLTRAVASTVPKRRPLASAADPPPAARARARAGVVIYTTSWCGWCRKTIAWLDRQGVDYENRDIERNPAWRNELIDKTGGTSIPVVEIDGELIRGFDPTRMSELL